MKHFLLLITLAAGFAQLAHADDQVPVSPSKALEADPRQGWYFYYDPVERKKAEDEAAAQANAKTIPNPEKPAKDCKKKDEWEASCGFVNPGTDFEFQAKQRDALMQQFAMQASNPKAVEAFQRYQAWVTDQAITASNVWVWNQVQNTDLDASVTNPVSALGLQLSATAKTSSAKDLLETTAKAGGRLLIFSRTNCDWCHSQLPLTQRVAKSAGLPLWNITLDDKCLPGMEKNCVFGPIAIALAKELRIKQVPAEVLFVPENTWIKLATGITTEATLRARLVNFLAAYKGATQESSLGNLPAEPDFSKILPTPSGTAVGVK